MQQVQAERDSRKKEGDRDKDLNILQLSAWPFLYLFYLQLVYLLA